MKYITIILAAALLSSCSIFESTLQTDKRRVAKASKRSPQIFQTDTVYKTLEVAVPYAHIDTVLNVQWFTDTISYTDTFTKENERVKIQIIRIKDTVKVSGECKPDTVRIETPIAINTEVDARMKMTLMQKGFLLAGILILSLTLLRLWRK